MAKASLRVIFLIWHFEEGNLSVLPVSSMGIGLCDFLSVSGLLDLSQASHKNRRNLVLP